MACLSLCRLPGDDRYMDEIESYPILKTTSELFAKLTNIRCFRTSTGTWQTMVCDTPLAVNLQSEDIAAKAADLARNQSP